MHSEQRGGKVRLFCIDQARAVAIGAMILAHFGPGLVERLPIDRRIGDAILTCGRIATPAFAVIFGITVGLVYLPKYLSNGEAGVAGKLLKRALLVGSCAVALSIPNMIPVIKRGGAGGEVLFSTYSVLVFYTIALALLPLTLRAVASRVNVVAPALGLASWAFCLWVRDAAWPDGGAFGIADYARLLFFSGKYAVFLMMGSVLLAMPLGYMMYNMAQGKTGRRVVTRMAFIGAVGMIVGGSRYLIVGGRFDGVVARLNADVISIWYHILFGSAAILMVCGFHLLNQAHGSWMILGKPLAVAGQCSLPIYTMHAFVLPSVHLVDRVYNIQGPLRSLFPMALFALGLYVIIDWKINGRPSFPMPRRRSGANLLAVSED